MVNSLRKSPKKQWMDEFRTWVVWDDQRIEKGGPKGYGAGKTERRILEGKGLILPGRPIANVEMYRDDVGQMVEKFLIMRGVLGESDRQLIKTWFLFDGSLDEKARQIGCSRRQLVRRITRLYEAYRLVSHKNDNL